MFRDAFLLWIALIWDKFWICRDSQRHQLPLMSCQLFEKWLLVSLPAYFQENFQTRLIMFILWINDLWACFNTWLDVLVIKKVGSKESCKTSNVLRASVLTASVRRREQKSLAATSTSSNLMKSQFAKKRMKFGTNWHFAKRKRRMISDSSTATCSFAACRKFNWQSESPIQRQSDYSSNSQRPIRIQPITDPSQWFFNRFLLVFHNHPF